MSMGGREYFSLSRSCSAKVMDKLTEREGRGESNGKRRDMRERERERERE